METGSYQVKAIAFKSWALLAFLTFGGLFARFASAADWEDRMRVRGREAGLCEEYLSLPDYAPSKTFSHGSEPEKTTLHPEPGSIENMYPGTIRELMDIRLEIINMRKALPEGVIFEPQQMIDIVSKIDARLEQLFTIHKDARLRDLIISQRNTLISVRKKFVKRDTHENLPMVLANAESSMWELIVACLFDGKKIHINQHTGTVFAADINRLNSQNKLSNQQKKDLSREIDILIQHREGGWRWIEVKDWASDSIENGHRFSKVLLQAESQDHIRKTLGLNVEMILVLKHGSSTPKYLRLKLDSKFDKILFVYPEQSNRDPAGVATPVKWNQDTFSVCWHTNSLVPIAPDFVATVGSEKAAKLSSPHKYFRRQVEDAIKSQYTLDRVGVHFIGWKECTPNEKTDIQLLYSNYSNVNIDLGGTSSNIGRESVKSKSAITADSRQMYIHFSFWNIDEKNLPDSRYCEWISKRIIKLGLHEFGHIAGLIHEDEERVYTPTRQVPVRFSAFDTSSIMHKENFVTTLSPGDIHTLRCLYRESETPGCPKPN